MSGVALIVGTALGLWLGWKLGSMHGYRSGRRDSLRQLHNFIKPERQT